MVDDAEMFDEEMDEDPDDVEELEEDLENDEINPEEAAFVRGFKADRKMSQEREEE